jgi:hypothetical protein
MAASSICETIAGSSASSRVSKDGATASIPAAA